VAAFDRRLRFGPRTGSTLAERAEVSARAHARSIRSVAGRVKRRAVGTLHPGS
jgi:hypothetical protein